MKGRRKGLFLFAPHPSLLRGSESGWPESDAANPGYGERGIVRKGLCCLDPSPLAPSSRVPTWVAMSERGRSRRGEGDRAERTLLFICPSKTSSARTSTPSPSSSQGAGGGGLCGRDFDCSHPLPTLPARTSTPSPLRGSDSGCPEFDAANSSQGAGGGGLCGKDFVVHFPLPQPLPATRFIRGEGGGVILVCDGERRAVGGTV